MDLKQYLALLRRRWLYVLVGVLVGTTAAAAFVWSQAPTYTANAVLFVSTPNDQVDASQAYQGGLFSQQRVQSYVEIVSSPPVVSAVKKQLGLDESVPTLQARITASAPLNTVLIDVSVKDRQPARARDIANAVTQQFIKVVNDLEAPQGAKVSPVKVTVVQPAELPTAPSSPNKKLDLAIGLLLGLVLGVVGAQLRDTLDTTVRSKDRAEKLADAPVLASIVEDTHMNSRQLIVRDDRFSLPSEAFRQLRTSVRFFNVDKHVRALVVTSSVAGEGATTVASNLAVALAQSGDQVILVDANLRQPMVSELFGLDPAVGLTTVLTELPRLDDALQRWHRESALRVLTSGSIPPNPSELLGSHRMLDVISALKERAAVVVFDTPPLLPVTDAAALSRLTDGVLVVCRAHSTTADQLERASQSLKSVGTQVLGLVLNRVSYRRSASDGAYNSPTAQAAGGEAPGAPAERQVRRQHVSTSGRHA